MAQMQASVRSDVDVRTNWEVVRTLMVQLGIPSYLLDKPGLTNARFKPCYSFLVMLYFLHHLSHNHDFACDFAYPVEPRMASFLQSSASVEVLARAGSIRHHSDNNERLDGMHMKPSQQVVRFSTGKISFPGHVEENRTGAAQPSSSHPQHKNAANTNMRERDNAPIVHSTRHDIRLLEGRLHDPHFLAIAPSRHELEKTSPSASSTTSTSARRK